MLARSVRERLDVPVVFTYHTKFDIDIANAIRSKLLQEEAAKILVENISACDEIWTVSNGAGENLKKLGYRGEYIVMPNGVDFPRGRVDDALISEVTAGYDLPEGMPVFLFVGRMMWYKGIRISLDALKMLKDEGLEFRMVFVGGGTDKEEIVAYSRALGLDDCVFFCDPIHDRNRIRAWYCRADLFLFPSTFDTNGLVVREAAARSLASVLVKGSCAAEGVKNGVDGFMIEENAASLAVLLARLMDRPDVMHAAGEKAAQNLYISWGDAVKAAYERYPVVIENYRAGKYKKAMRPSDGLYKLSAEMMDSVNRFYERQNNIRQLLDPDELRDRLNQLDTNATQLLNRFDLGDLDHLGRSKPKESPGSPKLPHEIQDKYL
jgi:glycosyltransferase involved in cell wall biosynthesis